MSSNTPKNGQFLPYDGCQRLTQMEHEPDFIKAGRGIKEAGKTNGGTRDVESNRIQRV